MTGRTSTPTDQVAAVRRSVDDALARRVQVLHAQVDAFGSEATVLVDALEAMLAGGKRLRPAFTWWGWRLHSPSATVPVAIAQVGAAHELFQAAALVHDDVMDDSDTRRGAPASHRRLATFHRTRQYVGDPDRFGASAALLLGDLALTTCDQELAVALLDQPPHLAVAVREIFATMQSEVWAGQYLDLLAQVQPPRSDPRVDEARAWQVIRSKSARYSVEHPFVIGAVLAGAAPEQIEVCRQVGLPVGEAFQLRDDILGLLGDPTITGKPSGDDLREGKRTVLVARAAMRAWDEGDESTLGLLTRHLGNPTSTQAELDALTDAIIATGAVDEVEAMIAERTQTALEIIDRQPWAPEAADGLRELIRLTVDRTA